MCKSPTVSMKHETSWPEYANAQELLERHLVGIGNFTFRSVTYCLFHVDHIHQKGF